MIDFKTSQFYVGGSIRIVRGRRGGITKFSGGDKSLGVGPGPNFTGSEVRRDGL